MIVLVWIASLKVFFNSFQLLPQLYNHCFLNFLNYTLFLIIKVFKNGDLYLNCSPSTVFLRFAWSVIEDRSRVCFGNVRVNLFNIGVISCHFYFFIFSFKHRHEVLSAINVCWLLRLSCLVVSFLAVFINPLLSHYFIHFVVFLHNMWTFESAVSLPRSVEH